MDFAVVVVYVPTRKVADTAAGAVVEVLTASLPDKDLRGLINGRSSPVRLLPFARYISNHEPISARSRIEESRTIDRSE